MKEKMPRLVDTTILSDALHNMSANEARNEEYARAILVGCVSALMACGIEFPRALKLCSEIAPRFVQPNSVPESWQKDFGVTEANKRKDAWERTRGRL
jgi:hypothetical protein